jgi:hypothetical protein
MVAQGAFRVHAGGHWARHKILTVAAILQRLLRKAYYIGKMIGTETRRTFDRYMQSCYFDCI